VLCLHFGSFEAELVAKQQCEHSGWEDFSPAGSSKFVLKPVITHIAKSFGDIE
jgi:hypothetical protein